ncbi:hypothetical protein M407DRAFT_5883 [Tulasnella calospora MUT 4182]|uniref:CASTOR ACT domain-containing protein n=1 Tax=Tulasnella calospora MUT 4182 TaxID=1051891 RepID=A0A0C3QQX4_9AGAM|nr:hypothetical protein M407DRAFT_5883 [Tulasnella calospora MUT 4182]
MDYTNTTTPYELTPTGGAVTITALPGILSLVRIPKHRLSHFAHPIIKLILSDSTPSTFLNISTNASEVSIIAREQDLSSFVKVARKDNRRIRRQVQRNVRRESEASAASSSSAPRSGQESGAPSPVSVRPSPRSRRERVLQPVEVSSSWSALQIDSHGEQLGDASARIREISWLLAGISILYQSSYTTDYIFVQSRLLPEVLSILSNANFLSLSSIPSDLSSQISSLVSSSSTSTGPSTRSTSPHPPEQFVQPDLAALGLAVDGESRLRARRGTASSHASLHSMLLAKSASGPMPSSFIEPMSPSSPKSQSPSSKNDAASPTPTTTPAMPQRSATARSSTLSSYRPSVTILSSDLVVVGLSEQFESHSDVWKMKLIKLLFFRDMLGARSVHEEEEILGRGATDGGERGRERCRRSASESNLDDFDNDVEPLEEDLGSGEASEDGSSSLGYSTSGSSSSSSRSSSNHSFHSTKSSVSPPSSPIASSSPTSPTSPSYPSPHMAFFSLTRTADGTSLTTDAHVLAKLFEGQRDLIYCGDEFERLESRARESSVDSVGDAGGNGGSGGGFLKCLHVDLKDFDLDRHGLVNKFSDILHSNNIHHLYCSTFKTANLLVDERDAVRAQKLLSEC